MTWGCSNNEVEGDVPIIITWDVPIIMRWEGGVPVIKTKLEN